MKNSPFLVLGLPDDATLDEVKRAYRILASKHHPDKGGDGKIMAKVNKAYEQILKIFQNRSAGTSADTNFDSGRTKTRQTRTKAKATSKQTKTDTGATTSNRPNFRKAPKNAYKPPDFDPRKPICGTCAGHGKVRVAFRYATTDIACPRCHGWGNDPLG